MTLTNYLLVMFLCSVALGPGDRRTQNKTDIQTKAQFANVISCMKHFNKIHFWISVSLSICLHLSPLLPFSPSPSLSLWYSLLPVTVIAPSIYCGQRLHHKRNWQQQRPLSDAI